MTGHKLSAERFNRYPQPDSFRPKCSCGWKSPQFLSRDEATQVGDEHLAATLLTVMGVTS